MATFSGLIIVSRLVTALGITDIMKIFVKLLGYFVFTEVTTPGDNVRPYDEKN